MNMGIETTLRRALVGGLLAMQGGAMHVVHADELGLEAGGLDGYRGMALNYQGVALWRGALAARPLELNLEYSFGVVQAVSGPSNRSLAHLGLTPFARWWLGANTGAEVGVGPNVFSGVHLGNKDTSTAFQFGSSLGLFHRLQDSPWLFGIRLTHYSNAGIKDPNPGQNYVQLRVSYVFP